jgi:hypothetical protein
MEGWLPTPAMPFWAMILLVALIGVAGWYMTRGR